MPVPNLLEFKEQFLAKMGAFDQIKDIIIAVDSDNNLIYLNNAAAKKYKVNKDIVIGSKLTELYQQLWFNPDDEHQAQISLMEKGFWEGVNVHVQPDGSKEVMESAVTVIKDKAGKKVGLLSVTRDITSRVNINKWLIESNQRLKYVVEAAGMMIYEIDSKTGQVIVIRGLEDLLGYSVGEVPVTIDWWIRQIHPEDRHKAQEQFHPTTSIDKVVNEYSIRHKNGGYIIVRGIAKLVNNKDGSTARIIGIMQDITKEKDLERQLLENGRMVAIGQTVGMVEHDIRNPLQSIIGDLFTIRSDIQELQGKETTKPVREIIEIIDSINENVDYINRIISDLQDYARQPKPKIQTANLQEVLNKVFTTINIPSNIEVQHYVESNLTLSTDITYIRRILTNLSRNAIQAMPDGGKLTIEAKRKEESRTIELSVADTGEGIPMEIKDMLFTPMFTTKAKGQGFGLTVVKKFVETLGGTISFESTEGKGTKFIINLPQE